MRLANASRKLAAGSVSFRDVLFRQFVDDDLGCASYLIGDPSKGEAFLVDPAYAIEQYLDAAREANVRIVRVLETHTHADHVSGHGRLALEHGVPVSVHPLAEPEFPFEPLDDGQELSAGSVSVRVIHTPGHRPEHCAFVVDNQLVLTGDSLFIGDAARPDLAIEAREGAEGLFHSLQRLKELPDAYEVYPGHVAGSLCGAAMSPDHSSTIGNEKRTNVKLEFGDAQAFITATASLSTPRPPTTARVVELNRGPFVGSTRELQHLDEPGAATILDVRPAETHAAGHVHGALNVPVSGSSVRNPRRIRSRSGRANRHPRNRRGRGGRSCARFTCLGFLELAGYVTEGRTTDTVVPMELDELEQLFEQGSVQVLDVREKSERDEGYIPGSLHIPFRLLRGFGLKAWTPRNRS